MNAPDVEDQFHQRFLSKQGGEVVGGRYDLESFDASIRPLMAEILEGCREFLTETLSTPNFWIKPLSIHIDYANYQELNAWAAADQKAAEQHFIALTPGLTVRLFALLMSILAKTPALDSAVAFEGEEAEVDVSGILYRPLSQVAEVTAFPSSKERSFLAKCCLYIILEYILFHEMGHIVHGHLGRLAEGHRVGVLGETRDLEPNRLDPSERRSMELDADAVAAFWCLNQHRAGKSPLLTNRYRLDLETYLALFAFSTGIAIHCFDGVRAELDTFEGDSHPHPELRFNFLYSEIRNTLERDQPGEAESLDQAFKSGIEELEKVEDLTFQQIFPISKGKNLINAASFAPDAVIEIEPYPVRNRMVRAQALIDTYRPLWDLNRKNPRPV